MIIRNFIPSDAAELLKLFTSTIREINIQDYSSEQVLAWAPENRDPLEWENSFLNKNVFVAVDEEQLCGFGELEVTGHINRFYVHKDYQGKKVGSLIYKNIESKARSLQIPRLFVEASITAKKFFERMGFINTQEQQVELRGVKFTNYRMEKFL